LCDYDLQSYVLQVGYVYVLENKTICILKCEYFIGIILIYDD